MNAWRARTVNDHRAMAILTKVALRWRAGAVSRAYRTVGFNGAAVHGAQGRHGLSWRGR